MRISFIMCMRVAIDVRMVFHCVFTWERVWYECVLFAFSHICALEKWCIRASLCLWYDDAGA